MGINGKYELFFKKRLENFIVQISCDASLIGSDPNQLVTLHGQIIKNKFRSDFEKY